MFRKLRKEKPWQALIGFLLAHQCGGGGAGWTLRYADVAADLVFAYGVDDKLVSLVRAVWIENDGLI